MIAIWCHGILNVVDARPATELTCRRPEAFLSPGTGKKTFRFNTILQVLDRAPEVSISAEEIPLWVRSVALVIASKSSGVAGETIPDPMSICRRIRIRWNFGQPSRLEHGREGGATLSQASEPTKMSALNKGNERRYCDSITILREKRTTIPSLGSNTAVTEDVPAEGATCLTARNLTRGILDATGIVSGFCQETVKEVDVGEPSDAPSRSVRRDFIGAVRGRQDTTPQCRSQCT